METKIRDKESVKLRLARYPVAQMTAQALLLEELITSQSSLHCMLAVVLIAFFAFSVGNSNILFRYWKKE